jgi:hypothetical protein
MVQALKTAIDAMTRLEKILTAFGGFSLGVTAFVAFVVGDSSLAGQVDLNTQAIATQDSIIVEIQHHLEIDERQDDHMLCLLEAIAGNGRRTPTQCSVDFGTGW